MLFLIGFGLSVVGGVMIILYLNLIPAGLSFKSYLIFIAGRMECQLFIVGCLIMLFSYSGLLRQLK
ncbi:hypothetical protein SAMN05421734_10641 [Pelagirhabdus alkalitolerans]|uniref:Uncharacterized protein n=1 Tax=Pelagirhabdus alkalitolerans TaxID=1612202 RepID=A0A1G6KCB6_9BACI|nr:hypothetical protein [Pelagirhabdus alkalitolerans]SDC28722.1 hypothetical protein SAMN05421734_10641 [Pelagirhabdus alkalitolerans]